MARGETGKVALKAVFGLALGVYFLGASCIFTPYYNWQYAQTHGFVSWLLLGEVVATAKAFAWPYFLFADSEGGTGKHFVHSIRYSNQAAEIVNRGHAFQQMTITESAEYIRYLRLALEEGRQAKIDHLNNRWSGLGDHYRDEFICGLEKLVEGLQSSNPLMVVEGHHLLDAWSNWYIANQEAVRTGD